LLSKLIIIFGNCNQVANPMSLKELAVFVLATIKGSHCFMISAYPQSPYFQIKFPEKNLPLWQGDRCGIINV
jgi:hypothetical protein